MKSRKIKLVIDTDSDFIVTIGGMTIYEYGSLEFKDVEDLEKAVNEMKIVPRFGMSKTWFKDIFTHIVDSAKAGEEYSWCGNQEVHLFL